MKRGSLRSSASRQTSSVPTSTPADASTTSIAASTAAERLDHIGLEVGVAGRVDERDPRAVRLERPDRQVDALLALLLIRVVVERRGPGIDAAQARDGAGIEEHRLGETRLACATVGDEGNVPDPVRGGRLHRCSLFGSQQPRPIAPRANRQAVTPIIGTRRGRTRHCYNLAVSGHSKWSQIKRQKGVNDAKRGALFTKLTREVITAARQGGGDVDGNYRLRMAVDNARSNSMPMENIRRAIERASGAGGEAEQYEEITYEGIGPANVALIVATMTDNRNRTASEVRSIFSKVGGSLTPVAWQFEHRGLITLPLNGRDPDELTLAAIDAGALDVGSPEGGALIVVTEPGHLEPVRSALAAAGYAATSAELTMEPTTRVEINDEKAARQVLQFVERLEDLDDVQNVYANFDIPDALLEQLEASVA